MAVQHRVSFKPMERASNHLYSVENGNNTGRDPKGRNVTPHSNSPVGINKYICHILLFQSPQGGNL